MKFLRRAKHRAKVVTRPDADKIISLPQSVAITLVDLPHTRLETRFCTLCYFEMEGVADIALVVLCEARVAARATPRRSKAHALSAGEALRTFLIGSPLSTEVTDLRTLCESI